MKNQWLTDLASQADIGREACSGNSVWSAIRNIQRSFRGLRPSPSAAVQDATGLLCVSKEAQITRWHQHFQKVLNVESQYNTHVMDSLRVRPVAEWLAVPPASDELEQAIASLSNNKAPGESGILPEMIKCAGSPFKEALLELIHQIWEEGAVPQAWRDAELVPIPKKGDLSHCNNWRGIALLDVVGKVVG